MALSEHDRKSIEAFREYIEDSVAGDERYGPATRHDSEDESTLMTRFEAGPSCWFEVVLRPSVPQIRVGFSTDERSMSEEVEQAIQEAGDTMETLIASGFREAGLDWPDPVVEHGCEGEESFYFATPLEVEDLFDLDFEQMRNKVVRMLEGYLVAFGPGIEVGEFEEIEEED